VAVVTGAASGIGLAMATRFAAAGMKLVLGDIETAALQRTLAQLQRQGAMAVAVTVDVADAASVERLADAAYQSFGARCTWCATTPAWPHRRCCSPPGRTAWKTGTGSWPST
jgi:NAD(P)-dependent dehydrogenase (short-subunit alcohol dehydrogenase family)